MPLERVESTLSLKDYGLQVHLGCTADERANPQPVKVSVDVGFRERPLGEKSDQLSDSVCYAQICEELNATTEGKEFNLVEKLAMDFLTQLRGQFPGHLVRLSVHKLKPPIANLNGGVVYTCGDHFE